MNEPFQHPLDKLYPNNSLLLLEAMIPYVDPALKLPLAMLIKIQELQILIQVLNNPSRMEACGLNRGTGNSDELLNALCKAMGFDFMEQMNTLNNMQNMMNVMQTMQNSDLQSASKTTSNPPDIEETETKDDMIDAIRQILSEQEGEPYES